MTESRKRKLRNWEYKYFVEWIVGFLSIWIMMPLFLILGIMVKITSRGKVFYVSERIGRNGHPFHLIKFRSMRTDAPAILGDDRKVLTLRADPRLTPIGAFLRTGFDELPQLFNVVKGDMCLIGPRPDVQWELGRYTERQATRLKILPGITGLAAVTGGRYRANAWNYEMDARYVERSTCWTDLKILLLTIPYAMGIERIAERWKREWIEGMESQSGTLP